jgi:hypothetical protein
VNLGYVLQHLLVATEERKNIHQKSHACDLAQIAFVEGMLSLVWLLLANPLSGQQWRMDDPFH